ncbi:hypothetical protein AAFF_G00227360 [Aldrovandia affinis]|uniref:Uncharacterized protein n=1 Tax=Aldrovandia affinis TaxID=143900 RepID=A0AAD7TBT5_9TELE|nr:hypothetical protein AAFF_G00227360 [Aldrovandia affinis]
MQYIRSEALPHLGAVLEFQAAESPSDPQGRKRGGFTSVCPGSKSKRHLGILESDSSVQPYSDSSSTEVSPRIPCGNSGAWVLSFLLL